MSFRCNVLHHLIPVSSVAVSLQSDPVFQFEQDQRHLLMFGTRVEPSGACRRGRYLGTVSGFEWLHDHCKSSFRAWSGVTAHHTLGFLPGWGLGGFQSWRRVDIKGEYHQLAWQ